MPPGTRGQFFLIFLYGLLALLWRMPTTVGILAIIASLFQGAGLVVVGLFVAAGVIGMSVSFGKLLKTQRGRAPAVVFRLACWVGRAALLLRFVMCRAPIAGRLHAPELASMEGRVLNTGQHLLTIFPKESPRLPVSARQDNAEQFRSGDTIRVRLRGRQGELSAAFNKVAKRAGVRVPHPALASVTEGPLAVKNPGAETGRSRWGIAREVSRAETVRQFGGRGKDDAVSWQQELATARITAEARVVGLAASLNPPLAEGEWGQGASGAGRGGTGRLLVVEEPGALYPAAIRKRFRRVEDLTLPNSRVYCANSDVVS